VPIVDAAMRQLKEIGWMHNRARMIVASYLVKDLLIDWRWGEAWFMENLLDGDPLPTTAAGSGRPAQAPMPRLTSASSIRSCRA
jgi:deoxyribodipyrimidine photo-lyase